jgi:glycosyltransferase involved in cell wall biosynthesis
MENCKARISIELIPEIYSFKMWEGDILGVIQRHHSKIMGTTQQCPMFLMWAQQFVERDLIFPSRKSWIPWGKSLSFQSPWATMTSVSSVCHDPKSAPEMERRVHEMINEEAGCIGALLWDEYAVQRFGGKYYYLPDVESCEADPHWRLAGRDRITLGSVGQLWGGRSVNLLAEILDSEKGFHGYLGGVLKPDSYTERAALLIQAKEGINVEEGFVESDEELNQRLRKLDAFVIDSRTYKCPSGLAIRAMAMGRPIVTVDSPSWIANLIKEYGVGVFWRDSVGSLDNELREWATSGGSHRSVAAAERLSDQRGMEAAFGEIFDRLKQASAA